jgi:hypothetical protein
MNFNKLDKILVEVIDLKVSKSNGYLKLNKFSPD